MVFEDESVLIAKSAMTEQDVTAFLEEFENSTEELLLKKAISLLENQSALRDFTLEQYCELHRLIITKIEDASQLLAILNNEHIFLKSMRDRDQFHTTFLETVMPVLVRTSYKFSEDEKVFDAISEVVHKCLFSSKEFTCYFTDLFEKKKCPEKHNLCKSVFKYCSSLLSGTEVAKSGFKLIFNSFSKSFKNFSYIYKMLVILIEVIGFDLREHFNFHKVKYQGNENSLNTSLCILNELLSVITKTKFELDYKLNEVAFSDFIKNLAKSVIALSQAPNTSCYEIFVKAVEINPLIVESIITELLTYVMLSDNSKCRKEYEEMMIKIFEVFNKLHRMQNLIAKMIPTLKAAFENRKLNETVYTFRGDIDLQFNTTVSYTIDDVLPTSILDYFTNCIINLASWQSINLFKTLLYHLNQAVENITEVKEDNIFIEILSTLTCWLLLSVRMAEHTIAENTLVKFVGGLNELKVTLGKFGSTLLQKEHSQVLMRTFLNMAYYWAEIYMTVEYYTTNTEIKMTRSIDQNFSGCNLTYLHPYLSDREWCLISERINNFGEKPCKEIMQKLIIQKLRALMLFGESMEELTTPIFRTLATDFDPESVELFTDKFVVNAVLDKMPAAIVINLAEVIVTDLLEDDTKLLKRPHIYDSQLIMKGVLCVVFTKINKLLKQKRKHDDVTLRKALYSKAISVLPSETFLAKNIEEHLVRLAELVTSEAEKQTIDLRMQDCKILSFLEILGKLPVIFFADGVQKTVILLLMALHKDIKNSNLEGLKLKCEGYIISIAQHSRFTLLDLFDPALLIKMLVDDFDRGEDLFLQIAQSIFRNDSIDVNFESGVGYIKENLKHDKCLKFAVILLHILIKIKKVKLSAEFKEDCLKFRTEICHKLVKIISKSDPEDRLVEGYALVLKTFLAKDENDGLSKLKTCLPEYVEYCLNNLSDANLRGSLLLFITILHNKSIVSDFDDDLMLRIWNTMKTATIKNDNLEDYTQLVMLITALIPNEQFSNIFTDLLTATEKSIDSSDNKEFSSQLKTWSSILSTNFNPIKTNILRDQLDFLVGRFLLMLKSVCYQQELCQEIVQFEVSIVQANHIPLTVGIMDSLLSSVSALMTKRSHDFVPNFNCGISLLESLLRYRNPLMVDLLPSCLSQYRLLLTELCLNSSANLTLRPYELQKVVDCAHKLEKLTKNLVKSTRDMSRCAMNLIADILGQYELDTLCPDVKKHLDNCIYSLMFLCDQRAIQNLMRVTSNASRELFKLMFENYQKYYRFTGKI